MCSACSVTQSYPTLCDPLDCSLPGSSVSGILQARILEWLAIPSSRGSSQPRDRTHVSSVSCIGRWIFFFTMVPHRKPSEIRLNIVYLNIVYLKKRKFSNNPEK